MSNQNGSNVTVSILWPIPKADSLMLLPIRVRAAPGGGFLFNNKQGDRYDGRKN